MTTKGKPLAKATRGTAKSLALTALLALGLPIAASGSDELQANQSSNAWGKYEYICPVGASALTPVDVLAVTGKHTVFLELFEKFDPEGFAILSDPLLADKTVWAPTDGAFESIAGTLDALESAEVKEILGYHISPPRSDPSGAYPVLTPRFLADGGELKHRTRTGVLTGSDQRTLTTTQGDMLLIEGINILPTSWCTAAGSVFSLNEVIVDVEKPGLIEKTYNQAIRILFYDDIRFFIYSLGGSIVASTAVYLVWARIKKNKSQLE